MGIEAFGVSINFCPPILYDQIAHILADHTCVEMRPDSKNPGVVLGELSDGIHLIEVQIVPEQPNSKCSVAVRFSLCNPDTVDSIFVDLVDCLLSAGDGEVNLMTSALKQNTNYSPGDSRWLLAALPEEIKAMRAYWQRLCGSKQGPVRVKDSFSFVGLGSDPAPGSVFKSEEL